MPMDGKNIDENKEHEGKEEGALVGAISKMLDILKEHKKPGVLGRAREAEKFMGEMD